MSEATDKPTRTTQPKTYDAFWLQDLYSDPKALLSHTPAGLDISKGDCFVALDANVLLAPYEMNSASLEAVETVYRQLKHENRLIVPAQAVREYYKHRGSKVADITSKLSGAIKKARSSALPGRIGLLEGDVDYAEIKEIAGQISKISASLVTKIEALNERLKTGIGSDRVSSIYKDILTDCICDIVYDDSGRSELTKEAAWRAKFLIAPGYKDQTKPDGGVGDLIIWKTILEKSRDHGKDCIFVTDEEKNDWWIKNDGAFQPRPELIEEYRQYSGGRTLHLTPLSSLLSIFAVAPSVVEDVKQLEDGKREANMTPYELAVSINHFTSRRNELKDKYRFYSNKIQEFERQSKELYNKIVFLESELENTNSRRVQQHTRHELSLLREALDGLAREISVNQAIRFDLQNELEFKLIDQRLDDQTWPLP